MVPRWPSLASKPAPALPTTGWLLACCAHVFLLSAPLTAECASLAGPGRRVGSNTGVHLLLMQTRIYRVHSEHQVKTPLPCAGQDGSQTRVSVSLQKRKTLGMHHLKFLGDTCKAEGNKCQGALVCHLRSPNVCEQETQIELCQVGDKGPTTGAITAASQGAP